MIDLAEALMELDYIPQWGPTLWHRVSTPKLQDEKRLRLEREFSSTKRIGSSHPLALKANQAGEIRRRVLAGEKKNRVAKAMGVHRSTVTRIMQAWTTTGVPANTVVEVSNV